MSVMSLTRSYLTGSGLSSTWWPHAVEMAVDVLNRTSGPEPSVTSYEMLTGHRPKVMNIMPFGCRAFAVKPRSQYSKTAIDPRAWVGVNLGRSPSTPGAYSIWLPGEGRVALTSDVYFMGRTFSRLGRAASASTRRHPARQCRPHSTTATRNRPASLTGRSRQHQPPAVATPPRSHHLSPTRAASAAAYTLHLTTPWAARARVTTA